MANRNVQNDLADGEFFRRVGNEIVGASPADIANLLSELSNEQLEALATVIGAFWGITEQPTAEVVTYDSTTSGLEADNVQDAIDEIASVLPVPFGIVEENGQAPELGLAHDGQLVRLTHTDAAIEPTLAADLPVGWSCILEATGEAVSLDIDGYAASAPDQGLDIVQGQGLMLAVVDTATVAVFGGASS